MAPRTRSRDQVQFKAKVFLKLPNKDQKVSRNQAQSKRSIWLILTHRGNQILQLKVKEVRSLSAHIPRKNRSLCQRTFFNKLLEQIKHWWIKMMWRSRLLKDKFKAWRLTTKKWSKLWIKGKMRKQEINWITLFLNFNKNRKNSQSSKSKKSPKSFDFQSSSGECPMIFFLV